MKRFVETQLNEFKDIFELDNYFLSPFIFRGQADCNWELTTSLERAIINYSNIDSGLTFGYETQEKWMIDEFKKKYHLYSSNSPKQNDNFEWLSIMQHHGCPTRLLDFTKSFFIAIFYAVIEAKGESVIWCINSINIGNLIREKFNLQYKKGHDLKDVINDVRIDFANTFISQTENYKKKNVGSVIPLEPNLYTERLSKQQGLFLMPTNSTMTFFENLTSIFNFNDSQFENLEFDQLIEYSKIKNSQDSLDIIKIIIPKSLHIEINKVLKEMNITTEILFPGIDGLALSLVHSHIRV